MAEQARCYMKNTIIGRSGKPQKHRSLKLLFDKLLKIAIEQRLLKRQYSRTIAQRKMVVWVLDSIAKNCPTVNDLVLPD